MTTNIFTLCDGAYNYNGKLTIVGTTDNIKVPTIPFVAGIGLALKISFTPQESGKKNVSILFQDNNGQQILPELQMQSDVKSKDNIGGKLVIAGNIQGLNIQTLGSYKCIVKVDNVRIELPFNVIK